MGIAGYWPVESTGVTRVFEQAVEEDAYAWHPELWRSGFGTGWFDEPGQASSRVRVWLGTRLLWERRLDGQLTHRVIEAWYVHRGDELGYLYAPDLRDTSMVLLAEVRASLDSLNAFGLPARSWRLQHLLDMWSGRVVATRVTGEPALGVERAYQAYDRRGRLVYERVQQRLSRGGTAVGEEPKTPVLPVERWLDPRTGRTIRERAVK